MKKNPESNSARNPLTKKKFPPGSGGSSPPSGNSIKSMTYSVFIGWLVLGGVYTSGYMV